MMGETAYFILPFVSLAVLHLHMDSVTQIALGAGITGAMLGKHHGRKALLAGAVLGTLPDLDVVIRHADPLTSMVSHRGFSHSLFVLTAVSFVLYAICARRLVKPGGPSHPRLFLAIWLALFTHPILDAFTAYGTQLFWPLKPTPASWSSIFIIDPFFTVPLLLAVLWFAIRGYSPGRAKALGWTLGWCVLYLALSQGFKHVIEARVRDQLQAQGHTIVDTFSSPEPFNILLWRVVARDDQDTYHEAIHSLLDAGPSESLRHPLHSELANVDSPPMQGLRWFSGDWVRYDEVDELLIVTDLRMGLAAGYYTFRFAVAERDPDTGQWRAITPVFLRGPRGTDQLGRLTRRIWQSSPPLPLAEWALQGTPGLYYRPEGE